jgi:hypothetical protein
MGRPRGPARDVLSFRRGEAWRLHVVEGRSLAAVGSELGVSKTTASRYVWAVWEEHPPPPSDIEQVRTCLVADAYARAALAFERSDEIYELAERVPGDMRPALYGAAAEWDRIGLEWRDRFARWSGADTGRSRGRVVHE